MVFLGIEVNVLLSMLSIPQEKLSEIMDVLDLWQDKQIATLKEVQKLAGLLNFACRCVRSGRVYLSRILNFLRYVNTVQNKTAKIPKDTLLDIKW